MKDIFIELLKELNPEKIIWKTCNKSISANEMIVELINETELSKQYVTEFLRLTRHLLSK